MAVETRRAVAAPVKENQEWVIRFTVAQRVEHVVIMVSFAMLMLTGLPQHFFEGSWSRWLIEVFGGIEMTRLIHRFFALIFTLEAGYHIVITLYQVFGKKEPAAMIPTLKDARDAMATIRYSFGLSETKPQYGRYSYRQKFEYWGVVFGTLIMVGTGFLLAYPLFFTGFLPGELIPAAKAVHGWEALLALSIIIIWHMYGTHLAPGKFPLDKVIFTGKMKRDQLREEHSLEYERLFGRPGATEEATGGGLESAQNDQEKPDRPEPLYQ